MDERLKFIARLLDGYKILDRIRQSTLPLPTVHVRRRCVHHFTVKSGPTTLAGWFRIVPTGGLSHAKEFVAMCDYSLHGVRNRPAKVGERLVTTDFGTGTRGFAAVDDLNTAVCLLPGTELAFSSEVSYPGWTIRSLMKDRFAFHTKIPHKTAIFRQVNVGQMTHHDALEFPDGEVVLLTRLSVGQQATVLQLPAAPRPAAETHKQEPAAIVA